MTLDASDISNAPAERLRGVEVYAYQQGMSARRILLHFLLFHNRFQHTNIGKCQGYLLSSDLSLIE